jgi:prepilin-type N-terminal cleavage/methylation domain-containing protein
MKVFKKSDGFTLVEIVVVIAIIALLSSIIYSSFGGQKAKSRDQKRVSDVSSIQLALELYFNKNGVYPLTLASLVPTYISSIPTDPTNIYASQYFPITKQQNSAYCISYQLWTKFEVKNTYLDSKKGFDSSGTLPVDTYECGGSGHDSARVNATSNLLIYDVMP